MPRSRVHLQKLMVAQMVKKVLVFMKPGDSSPWSQEPAVGPYPEPNESISALSVSLTHILILIRLCMSVLQNGLFQSGFWSKTV